MENGHEFLQVENKNNELLLDATRCYLAEEYAVFITLSSAADIAGISAICGLDFSFLGKAAAVCPTLYYPITATKGSALIFDLFEKIRNIYVEYSMLLSLPSIPQSSVVVDLIIPESMFPSAHTRSFEDLKNNKTSELTESSGVVSLTKAPSSVFYCRPVNDLEVQETAEKIMRMIDLHCKSIDRGLHTNTKLKYKNGIQCDIDVQKLSNNSIVDLNFSTQEIQQGFILKIIEQSVSSVKNDEMDNLETSIDYLGYRISLKMSVTSPSLDYSSNLSRVLNK